MRQDDFRSERVLMYTLSIFLGLAVGVLVGFMGVGGGIVLVPAMVYLLHLSQHTAQGTSLFLQLPPLGLGALLLYWKRGQVDLKAGSTCALGILLGGYFGSKMAIGLSPKNLRELFGGFLIVTAVMLWRKHEPHKLEGEAEG
jgi:uncharacterized membrane protein YfcA